MSVDIVSISIEAKSTGVDAATKSLNNLADASDKAEKAISNVGNSSKTSSDSAQQSASAIDKLLVKYQAQVDLLGSTVSQQNAYSAALKGGSDAQQSAAFFLGAEVDAYKALTQAQSEGIAMNKALDASYNSLSKQADAYYASQVKIAQAAQALNDAGYRAQEYKKLSDAQSEAIRMNNALDASYIALQKDADKYYTTEISNAQRMRDLNAAGYQAMQYEKLKDAKKALEDESKRLAAAEAQEKNIQDQAKASADSFIKSLEVQAGAAGLSGKALREYNAELLRTKAAQLGVSDQASPLIQKLQDTEKASGHAGGGLSGITRELIVLGHEASQGNFSRFGGSLIVLGERMDVGGKAARMLAAGVEAANGSVLAFLAPIAAIVAAIGLAAAAFTTWYHSVAAIHELNKELILTGGYAGASANQFYTMADAVGKANGNIGAAREAATKLVATGKFTSDQINEITKAAVGLHTYGGVSIDKTIAQFEKLAKEPLTNTERAYSQVSKAAMELDQSMHFLEPTVMKAIIDQEKLGNLHEASAIATRALAEEENKRAKELEDNMTALGKLAHTVGAAFTNMWNSLWTKESPQQKLSGIVEQLKALPSAAEAAKGVYGNGSNIEQRKTLMKQAALLQVQIMEEEKTAHDKFVKDEMNSEANAAGVYFRQLDDKKKGDDRYTQAKLAYDRMIENSNGTIFERSKEQQEKDIAQLHKEYDEKHKVKAMGFADINLEISQIHSAAQAQIDANDLQLKSIKDLSDARKIDVFQQQKNNNDLLQSRLTILKEQENAEMSAIAREMQRKGHTPTELKDLENRYVQTYTASEKAINIVNEALDKNNQLLAVAAGKAAEVEAQANAKVLTSIKANIDGVQAKIDAYARLPEAVRNAGITEKQLQDQITQSYIDNLQAELEQTKANNNVEEKSAKSRIAFLEQEIMLKERLRDKQVVLEGDQEVNAFNLGFAARSKEEAAEVVRQWKDAGKEISDILTDSFGKGVTAIGKLLTSYTDFMANKAAIDERYQKVVSTQADNPDGKDAATKIEAAKRQAISETSRAQLKSYADMSSAAQKYFKEGSLGYNLMGGAEKVFRAMELAEAIKNFAVKSGLLTAFTGLFGVAKTTEVAATIATVPVTLAAEGVKQTALATTAMAGAIAVPFPGNLVAVGIVAAMLAAIGLSSMGGSSAPPTSEVRQAQNGTGSVLGDNNAKSDSIQKALDIIAKDSGLGLVHFSSMDKSLQTLVTGIAGLSSLLVSGTKLTAPVAATTYGNNALSSAVTSVAKIADITFGMVDKITGGLSTKITAAIFGGKTSVQDVGLQIGKDSLSGIAANGATVQQYTDIKKSGGWFSSDKYSTQTQSLGQEVNNQFSMIINSLADTVKMSAKTLGMAGTDFEDKLGKFVVDIGEISTKGLTGDQIQKALETAFSKLGDDMAKFAIQGLDKFAKVGEGYLETVARLANDLMQVQDVFATLGQTVKGTGIEAVTTSENLIAMFGSLDKLTTSTKYFLDNFLTDAERAVPVQKSLNTELTRLGLSTSLSVDEYKKLVQTQDLNTSAGQEMYAALMNIAPAFKQVTDATDSATKAAQDQATSLLKTQLDMQMQIATLTGNSSEQTRILAQQRQIEIDALDASLKPYQEHLNNLNDEQAFLEKLTAAEKAAADLQNSRLNLESKIATLTGDTAEQTAIVAQQRKIEIDALDKSLRPLQERLNLLTDEAAAEKAAADLLSKKLGLELQIYNLTGDAIGQASVIAQQRKIELAAMDVSLRPLQERVYQLTDEAAALKAATDARNSYITSLKDGVEADFKVLGQAISQAKTDAQASYDAQSAILNAQMSSLQQTSTTIKALGSALDGALNNMLNSTNLAISRTTAQAMLDKVLITSRNTGILPTADSLKDVLPALTKDSSSSFSSYKEYIKDAAITAGKLSELNDRAKTQSTIADQQIIVLQKQLDLSKVGLSEQLADFDKVLSTAQSQLDVMNGTNIAIKTLSDATTSFNYSYLSVMNYIASSMAVVAHNTSTGADTTTINGSHANGLDNVPFDGYTAKLHKGEMVLPSKQAKGIAQAEDMKAVVEAIDRLCADNSAENQSMVSDIRWVRKLLQNVSPTGQTLQVTIS